jgi:hypothetical protein
MSPHMTTPHTQEGSSARCDIVVWKRFHAVRSPDQALLDAATLVHDGDLRSALRTAQWVVRALRRLLRRDSRARR